MRRFLILISVLAFAPSAWGTITYVQRTDNSATSVGTISATFGSNNTAGCLIIVTAADIANAPALNTPTDTAGDTFTLLDNYFGLNPFFASVSAWYTTSCVGGANVVTVTGTNQFGMAISATEYSGTSITLDQHAVWPCGHLSNAGVIGVTATPPMYTSNANELVFAWAYDKDNNSVSVNSPYTFRGQTTAIGSLATADRSVSTKGTHYATFTSATTSDFLYAGAVTFSEGGIVTIPPIQQLVCGDSIQAWHELGTFSGQDVLLGASKSGDYIFVAYRADTGGGGTPTISDVNGYSWNVLQSATNVAFWYTGPLSGDKAAGDIISFGNIAGHNASRVIEVHGLPGLPTNATSSGNTATMALSLSGYTTPPYCTTRGGGCSSASQWYGLIQDTRSPIKDFLIIAESDGAWEDSPPTIPGSGGTDLFPTDLSFLEVWLPGAVILTRHKSIVY